MRSTGTVFACLAVFASGCATSVPWGSAMAVDRSLSSKHPDASAVLLSRTISYRMQMPLRDTASYEEERHDILAILTEGGFKHAEVRIPLDDESSLLFLQARTISPEGVTQEVKPEEVFTAKTQAGAAQEKRKWNTKTFRFPGIKVGSVIETRYRVEHPGALFWRAEKISADIPVDHYRLEMVIPDAIKFAFKLYNTAVAPRQVRGDGQTTVTIEADNVPAGSQERLAPPWQTVEPRWAYRAKSFEKRLLVQIVYDTWSSMLASLGKRAFGDVSYYEGVDLTLDTTGCKGDRRCVLERAVAFVAAKTALTKFVGKPSDVRPLKEVLATGLANNFEKALLLRGVLRSAGVATRLALVGREAGLEMEHEFPLPNQFDHLVIAVEPQPGVPQRLFLDPSCEQCAVGQLSGWIEAREALVMDARGTRLTDPEVLVEFVPIDGDAPKPSTERRQCEVELDNAGAIKATLTSKREGQLAVDWHLRTRTWLDKQWRENAEQLVRERNRAGRVGATQTHQCDRSSAECERRVDFSVANYATPDGAKLVVPLSLFRSSWDDLLKKDERKLPLFVDRGHRDEETITVRLPAGFIAVDLPQSVTVKTPAFDVALDVKQEAGRITLRRSLDPHPGVYPASSYEPVAKALRQFTSWRKLSIVVRGGTASP